MKQQSPKKEAMRERIVSRAVILKPEIIECFERNELTYRARWRLAGQVAIMSITYLNQGTGNKTIQLPIEDWIETNSKETLMNLLRRYELAGPKGKLPT